MEFEELSGIVFDIKELSVYDGPGIRTTVFLKGCPLRCKWCHNPEGLSAKPQIMVNHNACVGCGNCQKIPGCAMLEGRGCSGCGKCVGQCEGGCRKISGRSFTVSELCGRIERFSDVYGSDGGVTFSGGEPTMQGLFLCAVMEKLRRVMGQTGVRFTIGLQSCGYCGAALFRRVISLCDFVYFDIKHTDPELHLRYTGRSNEPILENLAALKKSGVPFTVRVPLIPGVNDTPENMEATAALVSDAENLTGAELLPYNMAAGAKYRMTGMKFEPGFTEGRPKIITEPFERRGIKVSVL